MSISHINGIPIASIATINGVAKASIASYNGIALPASGPTPLTSSDFTSDTSAGGTIGWSGTQCTIDVSPTVLSSAFAKCNFTENANIIYAQTNFDWTNTGDEGGISGLYISSTDLSTSLTYTGNYTAMFVNRGGTYPDAEYRLRVNTTSNVYDNGSTGAIRVKDIKITYNTSNNEIKFWYWNGSSWVQLGTTQTYNILQSGTIKMYLVGSVGFYTEEALFDKTYFGSAATDYSTQYPS